MVAQGHAVADELGSDPIIRRDYALQDPTVREVPVSRRDSQIRRAPSAAGLYDVLDLILDKGIVIDAFVRVSLVGIELVTVDLRVVIASVDTYLRYAEGVDRLKVRGDERTEPTTLPNMVGGGMKKKAIKDTAQSIGQKFFGHDEENREDNSQHGVIGALSKGVRKAVGRVAGALSGDPGEYEDEEQDDDDRGAKAHGGEREQREQRGQHDRERGFRDRAPRPPKSGMKR